MLFYTRTGDEQCGKSPAKVHSMLKNNNRIKLIIQVKL